MNPNVEPMSNEIRIEQALLNSALVQECVVLARESQGKRLERVAYIVPAGPFSPERLEVYLKSALPNLSSPLHFVPLFALPRNADGKVDRPALSAMDVFDAELIARWEKQLRSMPEVDSAAVVVRPDLERVTPLHLSDLLADWKPETADEVVTQRHDAAARVPLVSQSEYTPLALNDGGPLLIPAGEPRTLTEALLRTAALHENKGVTYIQADGSENFQSYPQLLQDARGLLTALYKKGLKPRDRVVLQVDSLKDHFTAFWACVLGGITPVTVAVAPSYRDTNSVVNKLFNTWKLLDSPTVLTSAHLVEAINGLKEILPMAGLKTLSVDELKSEPATASIFQSQPEDLVFFQLTSGSTGIPKCIQETHRGIIAHIHGSQQFNNYSTDDVSCNWLPVDHVVPILTCHIKDVYLGCKQVEIKTDFVLSKPLTWLDCMESHRATHSWSPNFGFKLVSDALVRAPERKWDLSSLKFLMNAGEQVTLPVVRRFLELLAPFGVKQNVMQPAFGMAEVCTCMTYQNNFGTDGTVHRVAKSSLSSNLKKAEQDDPDGINFIDLGPPMSGVAIRIADTDNCVVPEGVIGRLQIKGDVVTPGYLNNEAANREAFVGAGWFNSGDLGFMCDGRLTLTGREKEMIIIRGANFYCYEIEDVVNRVEGVEPTFAAACAVSDAATGTEGLAVFFVAQAQHDDELPELIKTIRTQVAADMGITPAFVIPLARKDFPKTTSGKIQRSHLKKTLEAGGFKEALKDLDLRLATSNTIPNWFFKRVWRPKERAVPAAPQGKKTFLVFPDELGVAAGLCSELREHGNACVTVETRAQFHRVSEQQYQINPENAEHYRQLLESMQKDALQADCILHLWTLTGNSGALDPDILASAQLRGTHSVLFLAQALAHVQNSKSPAQLYVVSNNAQVVIEGESVASEKAPMLGLIRTIPHEMPWLDCRHIDLSAKSVNDSVTVLLGEMASIRGDREVAFRGGIRLVPRLQRVDLSHEKTQQPAFKKGGMYVLSGGLGGVGVELARHLLRNCQVKLLLLGRSALPEKGAPLHSVDPLSRRVQALAELESLPGKVAYEAVDICDLDALRKSVNAAETRWNCELDGVIHLAGCFEERMLVEETRESFDATLRPKVLGTWALAQLLNDRPNGALICFSSVNSIFGGATVGAYAAANSFIDAFSQQRHSHSARRYCYLWSPWDEVGMSRGYQLKSVSRARGYYAINVKQGIASLLAALEKGQPELVIGLDAANAGIRQSIADGASRAQALVASFTTKSATLPQNRFSSLSAVDRFGTSSQCRFQQVRALPVTATGEIDRERLAAGPRAGAPEHVVPRTELEKQIAAIWADALSVSQVGLSDNFFELGGNSLLAAQILFRLQDVLKVELSLRTLFDDPTVAGIATAMEKQKNTAVACPSWPMVKADSDEQHQPFPLTDIQQAYWVGRTAAFKLGNVGCHIYTEAEFKDLDLQRFQHALNRLIQRHPMLRCVFLPSGIQQVLEQAPPYELPIADLRGRDAGSVQEALQTVRDAMSHQVLETDAAPLFEIRASRLDDRVRLHCSFDLLIADARSFQILLGEMSMLYQDPDKALPPLDLTFRDYVVAAAQMQNSDVFRRSREYWIKRLDTLPPAPDLPLAANAETVRTPKFVRRAVRIEPEAWRRIKARAMRSELTPAGVLMGVYAEVLGIWSKRPSFTLNLTLFNRLPLHQQVNEIVGDFTSVTLLEVDRAAKDTFEGRCRRMQEQLWEDLNHRHFNGVQFLRELARSQTGTPATMPVVFTSILDLPSSATEVPALLEQSKFVYGITQTPQVWIDNQVYMDGDTLVCNWDAVEALFPSGMLDDMFAAYSKILTRLSEDDAAWQDSFIDTVRLAIPAAQMEARRAANATETSVSSQLLHTLFTEQAAASPDQPAIIAGNKTLTYQELDVRSNQIARQLRQAGAKPNTLVAVVAEKGWEQVVAAMGVLKSGAAYLPIDPEVPDERLLYLLEHGQVKLALTTSNLADSLNWPGHVWRFCVDDTAATDMNGGPLDVVQGPVDLAYVIYTSGSTGLPKGVVIDHRGAVNTILDINSRFGVNSSDRVFALSSLTFDLSVYDVFGILAAGGTMVLPPPDKLRDPANWVQLVEQHKVTLWNSVPALMKLLVDQAGTRGGMESLREVMLSGDWIPVALPGRIKECAPRANVVSMGGATEASIWSILYQIERVDPEWTSIPYGKPMLNQRFYVLNEKYAPCPVWVPGQLFIGGIGLAKGYWRDDERTRASFVLHPESGERLYRTGDLGRFLPGGTIEFLGREDFQVKINGFRIELGEIETALEKHPAIQAAVVTAAGERVNRRLVAHIVLKQGQAASGDDLREFLKLKLPEYMNPHAFLFMDKFPLTSNGKVDRRNLPDTEASAAVEKAYVAPRTPLEEVLSGIVAEILGIETLGVFDNFFELGGNSLLVIQVISRIRDTFDIELSVTSLFDSPTLSSLAEQMLQDAGNRERILRTAEMLLALADMPDDEVDGWLKNSNYV